MNRLRLRDVQNNFAEVVAKLLPGAVVQIALGDQIVALLTGAQMPIGDSKIDKKSRHPEYAFIPLLYGFLNQIPDKRHFACRYEECVKNNTSLLMFDDTANVFTGFDATGNGESAITLLTSSPNPLEPSQTHPLTQSLPLVSTVDPATLVTAPTTFEPDVRSGEALAAELGAEVKGADGGQADPLLAGGQMSMDAGSSAIALSASAIEADASAASGQSSFEDVAGTFVVGDSGRVEIDFLFDGGGYEGQLAVFSLENMTGLSRNEFVQEAARRALSNSASGQVVISDATEGAQFTGELGEADVNAGEAASTQVLSLAAGTRFAVMLVPNGTVEQVGSGEQVPFFSIAAFNLNGQAQMGKAADGVFAFEDLVVGQGDSDFNDLIFRVTGAASNVIDLSELVAPGKNWLNNPVAQSFLKEPTFSEGGSDQPVSPPAEEPAIPPVIKAPAEPPAEPPVVEPPAEPPVVEPPVVEPPAPAEPPVEEPPVVEPPVVEPPVVEPPVVEPPSAPESSAISTNVSKFNGNSTEAEIIASGAQKITIGTQTIYIGTEQVTSINQNPIIRSFDPVNPNNNWTRRDLETTGTDGRGLGLLWTGTDLYGVFSVDGTQSDGNDFREAASDTKQQWLRSFGRGGGKKIAVLGRIDPNTGDLLDAAHLSAVLSNGETNSLSVTGASTNGAGNIVVQSQSFFSPRQPDGSAKTKNPGNNEGSPFDYTIEIKSDLSEVVSTFAPGWA